MSVFTASYLGFFQGNLNQVCYQPLRSFNTICEKSYCKFSVLLPSYSKSFEKANLFKPKNKFNWITRICMLMILKNQVKDRSTKKERLCLSFGDDCSSTVMCIQMEIVCILGKNQLRCIDGPKKICNLSMCSSYLHFV